MNLSSIEIKDQIRKLLLIFAIIPFQKSKFYRWFFYLRPAVGRS